MTILETLHTISRSLDRAASDTETRASDRPLNGAIIAVNRAIDKAIALADPGKAWLDETYTAWEKFAGDDLLTAPRFAAHISAGELRKYKEHLTRDAQTSPALFKQIADLEAISKGPM